MRMTLALAALLLAGCGDATPSAPANQAEAAAGGEAMGNRLAAMPEGQRNGVFIRAIRDAGQDCQFVESSTPAGGYQGFPLWSARCEGGRTYTIAIGNAGEAQVIDDAVARVPGNLAAPANTQGE